MKPSLDPASQLLPHELRGKICNTGSRRVTGASSPFKQKTAVFSDKRDFSFVDTHVDTPRSCVSPGCLCLDGRSSGFAKCSETLHRRRRVARWARAARVDRRLEKWLLSPIWADLERCCVTCTSAPPGRSRTLLPLANSCTSVARGRLPPSTEPCSDASGGRSPTAPSSKRARPGWEASPVFLRRIALPPGIARSPAPRGICGTSAGQRASVAGSWRSCAPPLRRPGGRSRPGAEFRAPGGN
jgi:hypothetical protein